MRRWSPTRRDHSSLARLAPSLRRSDKDFKELTTFSLNEVPTGQVWIDERPIYRKVIDIAPLPNAVVKTVKHGIVNYRNIIKIYGFAVLTTSTPFRHISLPYVNSGTTNSIEVEVRDDDLRIDPAAGNFSGGTQAFVILEYTRN